MVSSDPVLVRLAGRFSLFSLTFFMYTSKVRGPKSRRIRPHSALTFYSWLWGIVSMLLPASQATSPSLISLSRHRVAFLLSHVPASFICWVTAAHDTLPPPAFAQASDRLIHGDVVWRQVAHVVQRVRLYRLPPVVFKHQAGHLVAVAVIANDLA